MPLGPIEGEERRINARWLAMVLVLLLPLGLIVAAIRALVDPAPSLAQERGIVAIAIAFILWIIPYFLSRIGRLHMTTLFIVATASIGIFFAAIFSNEPIDLFYLLLPILFGSVLLPRRIIWALATASTAVMLLIPLFRPEMSFQEHLHDPLGFFLIGVALTLLVSHHRQTLEQFRTGELIQANRSLQDEIAERKQAEQAQREQRILGESLRDTAAAINSTLELDEVLDRILTSVSLVVPHDTCEIMLVENGVASVVRCRGYTERGGEQVAFSLHLPVTETVNLAQTTDQRNNRRLFLPDCAQS